ncbi:MAG: hypothetical protein HC913_18715 [Microscillaceae bacterium]|nr:hypothetical protein [Microscillaceae bacterium]
MKNSVLLLFMLLIGAFHVSLAQRSRLPASAKARITEGYVSVALQVNAFHYTGDIPSGLSMTRPGLSAYLLRKLSPRLHARLGLSWGRIEGDDFLTAENSGTYARNFHFRNDLAELSLTGVWELVPSFGKHTRRAGFSPYLLAGWPWCTTTHRPKSRPHWAMNGPICNRWAPRDKEGRAMQSLTTKCNGPFQWAWALPGP